MSRDSFLIAQLSDIHCGSPSFDPQLLHHAVEEDRRLRPDLVLIGGDLTTDGYAHEFRDAQSHLAPLLDAELTTVVIPGNHDAKNVGYLHFTDSFGPGDVPGKGDRVLQLTGRLEPADMEPDSPGMHTTDTVDFEYVVSGRIVLELDDGETVELGPGDTVVQNGTRHAWRNPFAEPCQMVVVLVGATRA